jgi:hypothetical protein
MQNDYALFYIVGIIAVVIISKFLINWYHEIDKRNRYMEAQIKLLSHIATAHGVNVDTITEVYAKARMPKYWYSGKKVEQTITEKAAASE